MKLLSIFHCVADATPDSRLGLIPALKGWAKFMSTLRVAGSAHDFWGKTDQRLKIIAVVPKESLSFPRAKRRAGQYRKSGCARLQRVLRRPLFQVHRGQEY